MSAIRLALDQGVPLNAVTLLRKAGYDCVHASEAGMHRAEDAQILSWARELDAVIVTLDAAGWRASAGSRSEFGSNTQPLTEPRTERAVLTLDLQTAQGTLFGRYVVDGVACPRVCHP